MKEKKATKNGKEVTGVFYREHAERIHKGAPDRYFIIRYFNKRTGRRMKEGLGWASEGITPSMAERERARIIANIHRGEGPQSLMDERARERRAAEAQKAEAEEETWTFTRLWNDYSENYQSRHGKELRGIDADKARFLVYVQPILGEVIPEEVTREHIGKIQKAIHRKKLSPQTMKHILALIKRLTKHGVRTHNIKGMPFEVELPRVDNEKTECLTEEQIGKLLSVLDEYHDKTIANMLRLALATGMRRGEIRKLEVRDVDFSGGFLTIRNPKGGKSQTIPINKMALEILRQQQEQSLLFGTPYLFANPGTGKPYIDTRKHTDRIKVIAGLPEDFRPFHGLRHTFASRLASSGKVSLYEIQKSLTHKKPTTTTRYAHLIDEAARRSATVMQGILENIPKVKTNVIPLDLKGGAKKRGGYKK